MLLIIHLSDELSKSICLLQPAHPLLPHSGVGNTINKSDTQLYQSPCHPPQTSENHPKMPGEQIPVSNPSPLPSHLPDDVLELAVQLERKPLPEDVKKSLDRFQRAACYIAAGNYSPDLIYLVDADIAG